MASEHAGKLQERAEIFCKALESVGVFAHIDPASLRPYSIKVKVERKGKDFGKAVIHYSANNDSFKLACNELRDVSIESLLLQAWAKLDEKAPVADRGWKVYVDGSLRAGRVGYGAVILKDGSVQHELSGLAQDTSIGQVAGELEAVMQALKWCQKKGVFSITLVYDYQGIESWATREWNAKKPGTQQYTAFMQECGIKIIWEKVKSHTGVEWNERADELARQAAGGDGSADASEDPMRKAQILAEEFIDYLHSKGLQARMEGIFNNQYARVSIWEGEKRLGLFDLYNARKRKLDPYIHAFKLVETKHQITQLWSDFRAKPERDESETRAALAVLDYYYKKLKPFEDCDFDFIDFAQALAKSGHDLDLELVDDPLESKYDFTSLERMYSQLKGSMHA